MLYKLVLFTQKMLKLIINAFILLFNISSDVRGMKIPRKKVIGQTLGVMSPPPPPPPRITLPPLYMVHSMSQGAGENNNSMSRIYIIVFMEFTGDMIDVIISSFQFFPFKVRNLWNKTRNTQFQVINISNKPTFLCLNGLPESAFPQIL